VPFAACAADEPSSCEPGSIAHIGPARIDAATWERGPTWRFRFTYRIQDDGSLEYVRTWPLEVTAPSGVSTWEEQRVLAQIAVDALQGYRFCPPPDHQQSVWMATIHFSRTPNGKYYMQTLLPIYGRKEAGRKGKVVVRVRFATSGVPGEGAVVESSGDDLLDRRAVESTKNEIILTKNGDPLSDAVVLTRPYSFDGYR
jgi:hypothetical protein